MLKKTCSIVAALGFAATIASAAVTWKAGPTFIDNGDGSFTATGEATGLGNRPAIATIAINATVHYTCQNKGGNESPGQNPVPATTAGSQDLGNSDHNGRGVINLTVGPLVVPSTISGKAAGCPNGNWSGINGRIDEGSLSATLTITQGTKVLYTDTLP
jgi:hypothetical protein